MNAGQIILAFSACLGCAYANCSDSSESYQKVTVCEIRSNIDSTTNIGVMVDGVYESNRRHHSYLVDSECGENEVGILIGRNDSESAQRLWQLWEIECKARGVEALCNVTANVRVKGRVRKTQDGLYLDVNHMELQDHLFK